MTFNVPNCLDPRPGIDPAVKDVGEGHSQMVVVRQAMNRQGMRVTDRENPAGLSGAAAPLSESQRCDMHSLHTVVHNTVDEQAWICQGLSTKTLLNAYPEMLSLVCKECKTLGNTLGLVNRPQRSQEF